MSKAFTREDEGDAVEPDLSNPSLPQGFKNYMTPAGFRKLQAELHDLLHVKRPELTTVIAWAAGNGDRSENADYIYGKRRLREIDRRIHWLQKRLEQTEVIDPLSMKGDQVFFGATVTLIDENGIEKTYSIVGIDEAEPSQGKISWISPLAKSLLKKEIGDTVKFRSPKGERELEITKVEYITIEIQ